MESVHEHNLKNTYWNLFVNRNDTYSVQLPNGSYNRVASALIPEILFSDKTIGLYQLDQDSKVKWAAIDFDIKKEVAKDDPNFNFDDWQDVMQQQVLSVSELLTSKGIPNYIEFSGFRGYHIWIFFEQPVEASKVKSFMEEVAGEFESVDENISYELFPKQSELKAHDNGNQEYGNLLKAPLQMHLKSGKTTYFVDSEFNQIDGLPKVEYCPVDKLQTAGVVKVKHAPKNFMGIQPNTTPSGSFPMPDNIQKMVNGCSVLKRAIKDAERKHHLFHNMRIIIASIGRFFGEEGRNWVHSIIKHCTDYNEKTTDYQISTLSGAPIKCESIRNMLNCKCVSCKNPWATPLGLGYTTIPKHYMASKQFVVKKLVPELLHKLSLPYAESANHYIVDYKNSSINISKNRGTWLKQFNLIDLTKFVRPDDWELFLHENFSSITVDKFAFESTDKSFQEIFEYDGGEVTFNQFISEADCKVEEILTDGHNYNIIAETGSGKTEAFIQKIKNKKLKAIYLTPYQGNAEQLQEKYGIFSVFGSISKSDVKIALENNDFIASTYDGLSKILASQISIEDYILIVDEVHNMVTHSSFRGPALNNIIRNMLEFKKVINITGTPEGVLNNEFKKVRFLRSNSKQLISDYTILVSKEDSKNVAIDHILQNGYKGKVIIFRNSKEALKVIKEALMEKGVMEDEIQILNAEEKETDTYNSIVRDEKIPDNIKYTLTTSVISDGVNIINDDIDAVYLLECDNLIQLRQFVARFRLGTKNVIDTIPDFQGPVKDVRWFDYPVELKRMVSQYEDIAETKNRFLQECGLLKNHLGVNYLKKTFGSLSHEMDSLRINKETQEVEVNYQRLTLDVLNDFHKIAYVNPERRREYLEHMLNLPVKIEEVSSSHVDLAKAKENVKLKKEEDRSKLIDLLDASPKETITTYLKKVNPNLIRNAKESLEGIYTEDEFLQYYFEDNKKLLKLKESEKLITKYIQFIKYKFPHDFIIELLRKEDSGLNDFELGYYTQLNLHMVQHHEKILKYNNSSLNVFYYAVFKYIYDFFKSNTTFTYDILLHDLNAYLIKNKIAEEKMDKRKFSEILDRMINKVKWTKKEGKKVKTLGWKFVGFKTVSDLVGGDTKQVEILQSSMKAHLENEINSAEVNLFASSINSGVQDNTEQRKLLNEMRGELGRIFQK